VGSIFCALAYKLEPPPRWISLGPLLAFLGAVFYLYFVRLPRILSRRHEPCDWTREAARRAVGVVCAGLAFMMLLTRIL